MLRVISRLRARKQNQAGSPDTQKSPLSNLYSQQRKLTAARHATNDPVVKSTLGHRSSMLDRRISKLQTQKD